MPFALLIAGTALLVSAVRGTSSDLFKLVVGDLQGKNSFVFWVLAILAIGSVGYVPKLKPLSDAFLVLLVVVLVLTRGGTGANGGLFEKLTQQINQIANTGGNSQAKATTGIPSLPNLPSISHLVQ